MRASAADAASVYTVALSNVAATTFTVTATPLHAQASRDGDCGSLTLNQAQLKGSSAGGTDCWK